MAVTFRLPHERPLDLVRFAWSPLFEATLSLTAVAHPKRTPMHLPWARRCRELPEALLAEIRELVGPAKLLVPGLFEVGLTGDHATFADELAAFEALDDDLVAWELSLAHGGMGCLPFDAATGPENVHDEAYRQAVLEQAGADDELSEELVRAILSDPATIRRRFARMFEQYWELAFATEWERIVPGIEAEVTHGARALVTRGVPGLVAALLPEATWDQESTSIVVERSWERSCDVAERGGLQFVPTVYGWPNVLIELAEPWPVSVIFPLRELRRPEVPQAADHEVAEGLRALGDETRLRVARLVAEQPRSTTELAQLLSMSDSAVSRHLKTLEAAGIVHGQRDGYFVLYGLRPERIAQLGGALRQTLGIAATGSGEVPKLPVSMARRGLRQQGEAPTPSA